MVYAPPNGEIYVDSMAWPWYEWSRSMTMRTRQGGDIGEIARGNQAGEGVMPIFGSVGATKLTNYSHWSGPDGVPLLGTNETWWCHVDCRFPTLPTNSKHIAILLGNVSYGVEMYAFGPEFDGGSKYLPRLWRAKFGGGNIHNNSGTSDDIGSSGPSPGASYLQDDSEDFLDIPTTVDEDPTNADDAGNGFTVVAGGKYMHVTSITSNGGGTNNRLNGAAGWFDIFGAQTTNPTSPIAYTIEHGWQFEPRIFQVAVGTTTLIRPGDQRLSFKMNNTAASNYPVDVYLHDGTSWTHEINGASHANVSGVSNKMEIFQKTIDSGKGGDLEVYYAGWIWNKDQGGAIGDSRPDPTGANLVVAREYPPNIGVNEKWTPSLDAKKRYFHIADVRSDFAFDGAYDEDSGAPSTFNDRSGNWDDPVGSSTLFRTDAKANGDAQWFGMDSIFTGLNFWLNAAAVNTGVKVEYWDGAALQDISDDLTSNTTTSIVSASDLDGAINDSTTSVVVTSAAAYEVGDVIQVNAEKMRVSSIVTNTLTVVRGIWGTTAAAHSDEAAVNILHSFSVSGRILWTDPGDWSADDLTNIDGDAPSTSSLYWIKVTTPTEPSTAGTAYTIFPKEQYLTSTAIGTNNKQKVGFPAIDSGKDPLIVTARILTSNTQLDRLKICTEEGGGTDRDSGDVTPNSAGGAILGYTFEQIGGVDWDEDLWNNMQLAMWKNSGSGTWRIEAVTMLTVAEGLTVPSDVSDGTADEADLCPEPVAGRRRGVVV